MAQVKTISDEEGLLALLGTRGQRPGAGAGTGRQRLAEGRREAQRKKKRMLQKLKP